MGPQERLMEAGCCRVKRLGVRRLSVLRCGIGTARNDLRTNAIRQEIFSFIPGRMLIDRREGHRL